MKTYLSIQYAEKHSKGSWHTSCHCYCPRKWFATDVGQALNYLTQDGVLEKRGIDAWGPIQMDVLS